MEEDRLNERQSPTLLAVCQAIRNETVLDFVQRTVRSGYHECFQAKRTLIDALVDSAFQKLIESQRNSVDPQKLMEAVSDLLEHVFQKHDETFWFNRLYHEYKTRLKPEADIRQLRRLLKGPRILDYGCGSGYFAARLAQEGYQVFTTDVMDYRYAEARHLPFYPMTSAIDRPYPDQSMDTALVQVVLHHIHPDDLSIVLQGLAKTARRVLIKEDTYDLPDALSGLKEVSHRQPLLQAFIHLPRKAQYQALVLIDFYANAVAQGIPEMNMPFAFKSVSEWGQALEANGLKISRMLLVGFEPGRMHKSCHVWFVCDSADCPPVRK